MPRIQQKPKNKQASQETTQRTFANYQRILNNQFDYVLSAGPAGVLPDERTMHQADNSDSGPGGPGHVLCSVIGHVIMNTGQNRERGT